jgi:hypothetical protein
MARVVTVEFGPSRSKRFGRALAEAQCGAGEWSELEPGRYRVRFLLGEEGAAYRGLARLLERVWRWRATEVSDAEGQASAFWAREMAWCASSQLEWFGGCRFRFCHGVLPRCSLCPLFDPERAIREVFGETPFSEEEQAIALDPSLRALRRGELRWQVPDFPPRDWEELG